MGGGARLEALGESFVEVVGECMPTAGLPPPADDTRQPHTDQQDDAHADAGDESVDHCGSLVGPASSGFLLEQ
ncbi:hypothetical protein C495_09799 [Natronorubrum sulfidifaciens JCM 14089]|uniref:Uncharacterized protein n=1 Tax=Natronorubrum sulfidifaciens JCM 14089 TaxID=1230460 RepID=L9W5X1_9EURY|nr:hypothetical protein C495_09799 [Natronorubrum sulfidifaciens JCM 14089]